MKALNELNTFLSSKKIKKNLDKTLNIINDEFEEIDPEVEEWLDEHWDQSWSTQTSDRWNLKNMRVGWNLDDIKAEFDHYFQRNSAEDITDGGKF